MIAVVAETTHQRVLNALKTGDSVVISKYSAGSIRAQRNSSRRGLIELPPVVQGRKFLTHKQIHASALVEHGGTRLSQTAWRIRLTALKSKNQLEYAPRLSLDTT